MIDDTESRIDSLKEAYVQGRLSPEEQANFESYFIDKPDLLDELELSEVLRSGLKHADQSPQKKNSDVPWRLAAAAVLTLGIGAFSGYFLAQQSSYNSDEAVLSAQIVTVPITRSTRQRDISFRKSDLASTLVFRVRLADPKTTLYRITITDDSGVARELPVVSLHAGDFINFSVRSEFLEFGAYEFVIYEKGPGKTEQSIDVITVNVE